MQQPQLPQWRGVPGAWYERFYDEHGVLQEFIIYIQSRYEDGRIVYRGDIQYNNRPSQNTPTYIAAEGDASLSSIPTGDQLMKREGEIQRNKLTYGERAKTVPEMVELARAQIQAWWAQCMQEQADGRTRAQQEAQDAADLAAYEQWLRGKIVYEARQKAAKQEAPVMAP